MVKQGVVETKPAFLLNKLWIKILHTDKTKFPEALLLPMAEG